MGLKIRLIFFTGELWEHKSISSLKTQNIDIIRRNICIHPFKISIY